MIHIALSFWVIVGSDTVIGRLRPVVIDSDLLSILIHPYSGHTTTWNLKIAFIRTQLTMVIGNIYRYKWVCRDSAQRRHHKKDLDSLAPSTAPSFTSDCLCSEYVINWVCKFTSTSYFVLDSSFCTVTGLNRIHAYNGPSRTDEHSTRSTKFNGRANQENCYNMPKLPQVYVINWIYYKLTWTS